MGIRGAGGHGDAAFLGRRDWAEPHELRGVRESLGRQEDGAGGEFRSERFRFARRAQERVGVGGGLLERRLCGRAIGREREGEWELQPAGPARRFLEQPSREPALGGPQRGRRRKPERQCRHPRGPDARP